MWDWIMDEGQKQLREQVVQFVEGIDRQLILDMDAERVHYPRQAVQEAARRRLLGVRFPPEWGGRGLDWSTEVILIEEVGVLGTALACLYSLPSIVGEAISAFGTPDHKERCGRPSRGV